ncbi:MAG: carbohydrate kinase [Clostridia bacterium]|nr:carbohydrate kinase [Clostridia bacterium]MBO7170847.1 carbohydrate kinase [Clostridia bacterium]
MADMNLGGLDIGTTGCKLSLYTEKGEFLYNSYREYDVSRKSGAHELDVETLFAAVCEVIGDTARHHVIDAIGVTSFGETFVALDENDRPVYPAMLNTDPRGEEECASLCARMDVDFITDVIGTRPHSMFSLPKMIWLKENLPEAYARIRHILLMEDYVVYMLSGVAAIDYSLAARVMGFDIRKKTWCPEIFAAAGIDPSLLSTPVPTGSVVGNIRPSLVKALGVKEDLKIVCGAHDQVATAVGAGVLLPGDAVDGTGTVECITPVFDTIPTASAFYDNGFCVVPYVTEGTYVCYAFSFTGGATLKWFKNNFAARYEGVENVYAALDADVPDGPTGLLVLPHFAGAATPYMDGSSRAAVVGLTLENTASDLYKALMEGVTYELMTNMERLENSGVSSRCLYATGGGAASDVWLQIKADILGRPITTLAAKEVGACGTCMMVAVGMGLYPNLSEAKKHFVTEKKTFTPNPEKHSAYQALYSAYRMMYDNVRPIIRQRDGK